MSAADSRRAWREEEKKKSGGRWAVVGAAALVLAGGGALWAVSTGGQTATPASCESTVRMTVVADPSIAGAIGSKPVDPDSCIRFDVTEQASSETAQRAAAGQLTEPLWIPDSSGRIDAGRFDGSVETHTPSLASTPVVVLTKGDSEDLPETWTRLLGDSAVRMGDPARDGGAFAAIQSVAAEVENGSAEEQKARGVLTERAQTQGVNEPLLSPQERIAAVAESGGAAVVAESDVLVSEGAGGDAALSAGTPDSGAAFLDYPLVMTGGATSNGNAVRTAGDELAEWFTTDEGRAALAASGLRPADGAALESDRSVDVPHRLRIEDAQRWDATAETYRRQAAPFNALVLLDASGSMSTTEPSGQVRWDSTVDTLLLGTQLFPARDSIGLWTFATDLGPDGEPYRVLEPVRGIEEELEDGQTQRERLQEALQEAQPQERSQTKLYESTLAAFRAQQENWKPGQLNAVVIFSDGGQQTADEDGMRIEELIAALRDEQDPSRPVYIMTVGVSEDADEVALGAIAGVTDGTYHQATNEEELQKAFTEGLSIAGG